MAFKEFACIVERDPALEQLPSVVRFHPTGGD
jgi:hypothetical protein